MPEYPGSKVESNTKDKETKNVVENLKAEDAADSTDGESSASRSSTGGKVRKSSSSSYQQPQQQRVDQKV